MIFFVGDLRILVVFFLSMCHCFLLQHTQVAFTCGRWYRHDGHFRKGRSSWCWVDDHDGGRLHYWGHGGSSRSSIGVLFVVVDESTIIEFCSIVIIVAAATATFIILI
jgi:hypothetical protein